MQWWEGAAGSLLGSGLLLTGVRTLWKKLEDKDKDIAELNQRLQALADRRISDLREMLKLSNSKSD